MSNLRARMKNGRWQLSRITHVMKDYIDVHTQKIVRKSEATEEGAGGYALDTEEIPTSMIKQYRYTAEELAFIKITICEPASRKREEQQEKERARTEDPNWRIKKALELMEEAASVDVALQRCDAALIEKIASRGREMMLCVGSGGAQTPDIVSAHLKLLRRELLSLTEIVISEACPEAVGVPKKNPVNPNWQALNKAREELQSALQLKKYVAKRS